MNTRRGRKELVMQEEVTKTLLEWATQIKEGVVSEFPKLAREIVAFQLWSSITWMVVASVVLGCAVYAIKKTAKNCDARQCTDAEGAVVVASVVISVVAAIVGLAQVDSAIKAVTAPRLVVVEKITSLVK